MVAEGVGPGAGGDEQVSQQHKRGLKTTLIATAGAMSAVALVKFLEPAFGYNTAASIGNAPSIVSGVNTMINDATSWLLAIVPTGGGLIAGYHWFMSGPGSSGDGK